MPVKPELPMLTATSGHCSRLSEHVTEHAEVKHSSKRGKTSGDPSRGQRVDRGVPSLRRQHLAFTRREPGIVLMNDEFRLEVFGI